jgi:peptidylprolyl isomerase
MRALITRKQGLAAAMAVLLGCGAAMAGDLPPKPSVADLLKMSKPSDWRPLDADNTLYMELPEGRVVIELAPTFAPNHAQNIKALVREHYFDGLAIIRSQDNWVVQWGEPDGVPHPRPVKTAKATLKAEFTAPIQNDKHFTAMPDPDGYAPQVGHSDGFPVGHDPKKGEAWLLHCYGMVGVARDNDADSGGGTQLYVPIGQPPRMLDRNLTVVGRVVQGMQLLSTAPRGTGAMGFYEKPEQFVPIQSVKVAADVPEAQRTRLEVMRTEAPIYQAVVEAQRNRGGPFTKVAAGYIDVCAAPIPVREQK